METDTDIVFAYLYTLADHTGIDAQWLTWLVLGLVGVVGHFVIQRLLNRFQRSAAASASPWDNVMAQALAKPSQYALWIVLLYAALGVTGSSEALRSGLRQLADTGLVLLVGWILHRLSEQVEAELLAEHRGPRDSDDRATIAATARLVRIVLWLVIAIMIMQSAGVSISGLLAFGGIGGIAVGFAAKDVLANFLGGLSIYLDRPFTVGDWIRSPDREIEGTVEHIGWRMTRIRTFDQRPLYVPNAVFSTVALENPSRMNNRRIYETFGIRYSDAGQMASIVEAVRAMLRQHEAIDLNRTLIVNFVSCGPSSLDFFVYTFTKTTDWVAYHAIKEDVLLRILAIIDDHGAEVAFPTRTLHWEGVEPTDLGSVAVDASQAANRSASPSA